MNTFGINIFNTLKSGVSNRLTDVEWELFVQSLLNNHQVSPQKELLPLFNATRFKSAEEVRQGDQEGYWENPITGEITVRRRQANIVEVELLILDYDGTLTIDEATERFKKYEYVAYTSYGHLAKSGVHKFRMIFPLVKPIPAHKTFDMQGQLSDQGIFFELTEALLTFAGPVDPCVLKPAQPYYLPSAPPQRIEVAKTWHNKGETLDWTAWKTNSLYAKNTLQSPIPRKSDGTPNRLLDLEQVFRYGNKTITAKDVKTRIQKVVCPFHDDKSGTEMLNRFESGVINFWCKRCGSFSHPPIHPKSKSKMNTPLTLNDALVMDEEFQDTSDRKHLEERFNQVKTSLLIDAGKSYNKEKRGFFVNHKAHILYLPEGTGKSRLALDIITARYERTNKFRQGMPLYRRQQVVFACKSWKQVLEKYTSFLPHLIKLGQTAQIAWSLEGRIGKRFKVKIKREAAAPFQTGKILSDQTIETILAANPGYSRRFVLMSWNFLRDENRFSSLATPDVITLLDDGVPTNNEEIDEGGGLSEQFNQGTPPAIIFTTFAQLRLVECKLDYVPRDWIIWIDDPDIDDLVDIEPAKNQDSKAKLKTIAETKYHTRPYNTSLGEIFRKHRVIYTTTEKLNLRLLEKKFKKFDREYEVHGDRYAITGGNITILGTSKVYKKFDAIIPLMAHRLNQTGFPLTLIADGIFADFNHTTSKGRNDLNKRHLLVEISQPHPTQVKTICDELGLDFKESRDEIASELMLDKMHQAIGRNSGYRNDGFECVVLVDKKKHDFLTKGCAYQFNKTNSVIIDRTQAMSRKEKRITETATVLVKGVEAFFSDVTDYLCDGRKVKPDINYVLDQITDQPKKKSYIIRLLVAISSLSGVRLDLPLNQIQNNETSQKVYQLGQWILNEKVSVENREEVFKAYQSDFSSTILQSHEI